MYGVDLYNFNYWWEAHEAWEAVWKTTGRTDDEGQFLQGLIQISAGMIKWWIGNEKAMEKLFGEGLRRLESIGRSELMGIDLKGQITNVKQFQKTKRREDYPFIELNPRPLESPDKRQAGRPVFAR